MPETDCTKNRGLDIISWLFCKPQTRRKSLICECLGFRSKRKTKVNGVNVEVNIHVYIVKKWRLSLVCLLTGNLHTFLRNSDLLTRLHCTARQKHINWTEKGCAIKFTWCIWLDDYTALCLRLILLCSISIYIHEYDIKRRRNYVCVTGLFVCRLYCRQQMTEGWIWADFLHTSILEVKYSLGTFVYSMNYSQNITSYLILILLLIEIMVATPEEWKGSRESM